MLLDVKIGDLELRPTETEQAVAAVGAGVLVLGMLGGGRALAAIGALALAGVGWSVYSEAQTYQAPELMNGYFQTGGRLSATRGPAEAAVLAGLTRRIALTELRR